jgi:hypothetical protein
LHDCAIEHRVSFGMIGSQSHNADTQQLPNRGQEQLSRKNERPLAGADNYEQHFCNAPRFSSFSSSSSCGLVNFDLTQAVKGAGGPVKLRGARRMSEMSFFSWHQPYRQESRAASDRIIEFLGRKSVPVRQHRN